MSDAQEYDDGFQDGLRAAVDLLRAGASVDELAKPWRTACPWTRTATRTGCANFSRSSARMHLHCSEVAMNRDEHREGVMRALWDFFAKPIPGRRKDPRVNRKLNFPQEPRFPQENGDNQQTMNPFVELNMTKSTKITTDQTDPEVRDDDGDVGMDQLAAEAPEKAASFSG